MPQSAKIVLLINSLIILFLMGIVYQVYMNWQSEHYLAYASATLIGGLVLCQLVILFKGRKLWSLLRAIIYALALLVAVLLVASLADLFTLVGFIKCLVSLVLTIYLIGLRGYLNSKGFLGYLTGLAK